VEQLTGLDAAFLGMETSTVHGHVGSVCLLDPSTASEPLTLDRLTLLVGARLHLIPAFRRRLVAVPLGLDHRTGSRALAWISSSMFGSCPYPRRVTISNSGSRSPACTPDTLIEAVRCGSCI
jgi:hypothetical protein